MGVFENTQKSGTKNILSTVTAGMYDRSNQYIIVLYYTVLFILYWLLHLFSVLVLLSVYPSTKKI